MKNKYILLLASFTVISAAFLSGCFTDTIDAFSKFQFQLVIPFHSTHVEKAAPDTSVDFSNLNKYKEYRDNYDRIKKALILQFNYWVDSLVFRTKEGSVMTYDPKDPNLPDIKFNSIKFYLRFADRKSIPMNGDPLDSSNYEFSKTDPTNYLLGEFKNVNLKEYFRRADHIINVDDAVAQLISDAVKNRSQFYIITEYSPLSDQDTQVEPKRFFPYVAARYDLVIKFEIEL